MSPLKRLLTEPGRFSFDAAFRILHAWHGSDQTLGPDAVRFRAAASVAFAGAEVVAVEAETRDNPSVLTTTLIGLTGPSAALPAHIGEMAVAAGRNRSHALAAFLDLLAQRMVTAFGMAAAKYRTQRDADEGARDGMQVADVLLALTGQFHPGITERLPSGPEPFRHYAGLFAGRPRAAARLEALASDYLDQPVRVEQFVGAWLPIRPDDRTCLPLGLAPGRFNRLGDEAAIGTRAWDQQARVVLRIGPLDRAQFRHLLPDRRSLMRLAALVRAYLGFETGFAVNLVLRRSEVPPLTLGAAGGARLGWNGWLPASAGPVPLGDADEPLFDADLIEAEAVRAAP